MRQAGERDLRFAIALRLDLVWIVPQRLGPRLGGDPALLGRHIAGRSLDELAREASSEARSHPLETAPLGDGGAGLVYDRARVVLRRDEFRRRHWPRVGLDHRHRVGLAHVLTPPSRARVAAGWRAGDAPRPAQAPPQRFGWAVMILRKLIDSLAEGHLSGGRRPGAPRGGGIVP